jgi:hypothetical protein
VRGSAHGGGAQGASRHVEAEREAILVEHGCEGCLGGRASGPSSLSTTVEASLARWVSSAWQGIMGEAWRGGSGRRGRGGEWRSRDGQGMEKMDETGAAGFG